MNEPSRYIVLQPQPFHRAPDPLQPEQSITVDDYIIYHEWSYNERYRRWPNNDKDADVLVGSERTRYRNWYVSGGRGLHVSNEFTTTDSNHTETFMRLRGDEIVQFVPKATE